MIIQRTDIFTQTKQHIDTYNQKFKEKSDISHDEITNLVRVLKTCNETIETRGIASDRQAVTDLSSAVKALPTTIPNMVNGKTTQEKVAGLQASLHQEKTRLENNLNPEKDRANHKVERSSQSKHS